MTSVRRRYIGWLVASVVILFLAALFAIVGLAQAVGGIPGHYEEAAGTVVVGGIDTIIRFDDTAGSEVRFEAFVEAGEGDSFTVLYDPAFPAESAVTPAGQAELVRWSFIIAAFLGGVAACLGGVAAWRYYRYPGSGAG